MKIDDVLKAHKLCWTPGEALDDPVCCDGCPYKQYGDACARHLTRHDLFPEIQESFDDLETAREVFSKTYRQLAKTERYQGWHGTYVEVTYYDLVETEYDEDGEPFQELGVWETAIAPLPSLYDDEED